MNIFLLLGLIFFVPLALFVGKYYAYSQTDIRRILMELLAYLILSSCIGDRLRARTSGATMSIPGISYRRTYARNMASAMNQGGWEQIEMENMLDQSESRRDMDERR